MHLILHRHARAEARDPDTWPDDRLRPLTDEGRRIERQVARSLVRVRMEPDLVLTSPWTRARETAEILIEELGLETPAVSTEALAAAPDLDALQSEIGIRPDESTIVLVGHSPWLEELTSLLLSGSMGRMDTDFPKSGVLGLEASMLAPAAGRLEFFWRPRQLSKAARKRRR